MIAVTEEAALVLDSALGTLPGHEGVAVRIALEGDRVELQAGFENPGDVAFDFEGRTILVIQHEVAVVLSDLILDLQETASGPALVLREMLEPEVGGSQLAPRFALTH